MGLFNSITIGADGLGLISYYDAANGNLKVAHCNNTACSRATTYAGQHRAGGRLHLDCWRVDGFGVISYYDWSDGELLAAHCVTWRALRRLPPR
jgi:hypothetical protein